VQKRKRKRRKSATNSVEHPVDGHTGPTVRVYVVTVKAFERARKETNMYIIVGGVERRRRVKRMI
jgi:hypothetical protein